MTMNARPRIGRLVLVLSLGAALAALTACSKNPDKAKREFQAKGDKFYAEKNYNAAIIEYRNALQQDSVYADAHYKLAQAYEQVGDGGNAAREFVRAADLMPDDAEVQVRAGAYLLLGGMYEDARGRAQKALAKEPRNIEAQLLLAESLAGMKDIKVATEQVEETIRMQPDQAAPFAKLGRYELQQGNLAKAEEAFQRAVRLDPTSIYAISGLANFYFAAGKPNEAEQWLLKGVEVAPTDITANRSLAAFYIQSGRMPEAEKPLKTVADTSPAPKARLVLADYYFATNRKADARRILEKLTDDLVFADVKMRMAILEYSEDHKEQAYKFLDEVLARNGKHAQASLLKGRFYLLERQVDKALPLLKTAVESDPQLAMAHYFLGVAYRETNDLKAALEQFGEVQHLVPREVESTIQMSAIDVIQGRNESALNRAYEAVALQPTNVNAHLAVVDALTAINKLPEAMTEASRLAKALPDSYVVQLQIGRIAYKQRDYAASEKALVRAVELSKGDRRAVEALVDTRIAAGRIADARTLAESEIARRPKESWLRIYAARVYAAQHDTAKAEAAYQEAARLDPNNLQVYLELTRLYVTGDKLDDARAQLEALVAKAPKEVWAHTMIGMILHVQNRVAEARQRYEKILSIDERAGIAANNLAMIYLDEGQKVEEALQLAQIAKQQMPDAPEISDTLGLAFLRKGMGDQARRAFEFSIQKDQANPVYQYHLGLAYERTGDKGKARASIQRALSMNQHFDGAEEARRVLASL